MKPRVFVGCSVEGLEIAKAIQSNLDYIAEVEVWNQGVFGLSTATLEALFETIDRTDFAVLVLTADDLRESSGQSARIARDNVLFELGLFMSALGRERTTFVYDRAFPPVLPSDLDGITPASFELHASGNLVASLGAACSAIQQQIDAAGVRPQPAALADGIEADRTYSKFGTTWRFGDSPKEGYWRAVCEGHRIFTAKRPIPRFTWSLARRGDDDIPFTIDGLAPDITLETADRSEHGTCTLRTPRFRTSRGFRR